MIDISKLSGLKTVFSEFKKCSRYIESDLKNLVCFEGVGNNLVVKLYNYDIAFSYTLYDVFSEKVNFIKFYSFDTIYDLLFKAKVNFYNYVGNEFFSNNVKFFVNSIEYDTDFDNVFDVSGGKQVDVSKYFEYVNDMSILYDIRSFKDRNIYFSSDNSILFDFFDILVQYKSNTEIDIATDIMTFNFVNNTLLLSSGIINYLSDDKRFYVYDNNVFVSGNNFNIDESMKTYLKNSLFANFNKIGEVSFDISVLNTISVFDDVSIVFKDNIAEIIDDLKKAELNIVNNACEFNVNSGALIRLSKLFNQKTTEFTFDIIESDYGVYISVNNDKIFAISEVYKLG